MSIQLIADSCCDTTPELQQRLGLVKAPLKINIAGGKTYIDDGGVDIPTLIADMKASKAAASSACPSPEEFAELMRPCDECFVVTLSSKLSGSYNAARVAMDMVREAHPEKKIHVFDSKSAAAGELQIALFLKERIDAGESFEAIIPQAEAFIANMRTLFVLEDLGNFVKNGRLNKVTGIVASILSLCPIMSDDGHGEVKMAAKVRGLQNALTRLVDLVAEIIDARIPISSRNPDIDELVGEKPRLIVLNRADQADPAMNRVWTDWFRRQGWAVLETNARDGKGVGQFSTVIRQALKEKLEQWKAKGLVGRPVRAMVVGVPNVGKSTFINQVAKRKSAKAGNRPGVTRGKQWVSVDAGLELLDTPGILWPKFEDETTGIHLAFTGAVKDEIMDLETLACHLIELLARRYPQALAERYKLEADPGLPGWELLELCGKKRGFRISGGEVDTERMAKVLLDEYRSGKLGNLTFETPQDLESREAAHGRD